MGAEKQFIHYNCLFEKKRNPQATSRGVYGVEQVKLFRQAADLLPGFQVVTETEPGGVYVPDGGGAWTIQDTQVGVRMTAPTPADFTVFWATVAELEKLAKERQGGVEPEDVLPSL